ncbi:putative Multidrug efflux transporter [Nitrospira sp. KM1]|uniref:efflux RND transporter permease subunit n=1 Tax=Nitrospira sp. KM1 TaxID=1936990 RepID=UPI0013A72CAD|nr:efflux RND transporter permease subunit [Nitrospira sp. KM1]BCA56567.1 putative Multidrug efflux transporter [Nitrospira sp. KM1]
MTLSDICIRRPVLATVMTLLLCLFGGLAFTALPVREYPAVDAPIVAVGTTYPGADARIVETEVTTVLEDVLSGIEGLRTIRSSSREEVSWITLEFYLSRDLDAAANDVRDRVARVSRLLPKDIQAPLVWKSDADAENILFLALLSDRHSELEITDFAERHIKDRLGALPGVANITLDGERRYAMRLSLDPDRLAARRLTVHDVEEALMEQNVVIPSGRIESERREFSVRTEGALRTAEQFDRLIIAYRDGYPVRLREIGQAEVAAEDDRKIIRVNGRRAVGIGVIKNSQGNTLEVAEAVKREVALLRTTLPDGMALMVPFDSSIAIDRSIREVFRAMGLSLLLVVAVIFLFLRSGFATLIPAVVIPASILGTFAIMQSMGFSINVLTLLGFVLTIGLVVDDAIIMMENIHRRIEDGERPFEAARAGSREIGFAVVATTLALVAVFLPIVFLPGMTGRLFAELGVAVAGSVLLSGFIALTLTPMMCARLLRPPADSRMNRAASSPVFDAVCNGYRRLLHASFHLRGAAIGMGVLALGLGLALIVTLPSELAPLEDTGWFTVHLIAPEGATLRYTDEYTRRFEALYQRIPELASSYTAVARGGRPTQVSRAASWAALKDWDARERTQAEILEDLQPSLPGITGMTVFAVSPQPFNQGSNRLPAQLVIGGASYEELSLVVLRIKEEVETSAILAMFDSDLELNKPELVVSVNRDKAADLGVSIGTVARTLETLLGGRKVTTFVRDGKEYPVIVKIRDERRIRPADIDNVHVAAKAGDFIPLASLVALKESVSPRQLNHYNKLRAVTVSAGLAPGHTLGEAVDELERITRKYSPQGATIAYTGSTQEYKESSRRLEVTFVLGPRGHLSCHGRPI